MIARLRNSARSGPRRRAARAFTLVEVLATLALMAIVLPAIMQGISLSTNAASQACRRTDAAGLAESKLAEIVATGQWQSGGNMAGDCGPDWPDYRWQATVQAWPQDTSNVNLQQIDLKVIWTARGREEWVSLSTLAYVRSSSQQ